MKTKTILKKNICYTNGDVALHDVDMLDPVPEKCINLISVDLIAHGVVDGVAWVEETIYTEYPRWLTLLFFWLMPVKKEKRIVLLVGDGNIVLDFVCSDVITNWSEEFARAPAALGIRDMWIREK